MLLRASFTVGEVTLSLVLRGGGQAAGHYVDPQNLTATLESHPDVPAPFCLAVLGSGLFSTNNFSPAPGVAPWVLTIGPPVACLEAASFSLAAHSPAPPHPSQQPPRA